MCRSTNRQKFHLGKFQTRPEKIDYNILKTIHFNTLHPLVKKSLMMGRYLDIEMMTQLNGHRIAKNWLSPTELLICAISKKINTHFCTAHPLLKKS